jgi:hypothetical protein
METFLQPGRAIVHIRPSPRALVRTALKAFLVVLVVGVPLAFWKGTTPEKLTNGLLAASLIVPALIAFLSLIVQPLGLSVLPEGLVGRSFWGPRKLLLWSEIEELRIDPSSGVDLLMIVGRRDEPTLWTLPSVIEDQEFQRLAAQFAGAGHPIVLTSAFGGA